VEAHAEEERVAWASTAGARVAWTSTVEVVSVATVWRWSTRQTRRRSGRRGTGVKTVGTTMRHMGRRSDQCGADVEAHREEEQSVRR
jgi:hypothetical protein